MIFTSCYYNVTAVWHKLNVVSISGKAPDWYTGRTYRKLAPRLKAFEKYLETHDVAEYTSAFQEVLDKLDPHQTLLDLGTDPILVCYEPPGQFCHRNLVADWLCLNTGVLSVEVWPNQLDWLVSKQGAK